MADTSTDSREDGGLGSATARAPQHENDDSRITVEDAIQRINSRDPVRTCPNFCILSLELDYGDDS